MGIIIVNPCLTLAQLRGFLLVIHLTEFTMKRASWRFKEQSLCNQPIVVRRVSKRAMSEFIQESKFTLAVRRIDRNLKLPKKL